MRLVVVGKGDDGRSKVVEIRHDVSGVDSDGDRHEMLWETTTSPPEIPAPRRTRTDAVRNAGTVPGGSRWMVVSRPPGGDSGMHRTDTLDYDIIVSGQMTMILEDGEIVLDPGDAVLIPGLPHRWVAGPEGCVFTIVLLGLDTIDSEQ